jgi:hypothetical protein
MARKPTKNKRETAKSNQNSANLGFEAKLWAAADALRNNMDAAEYKHVVLGLIFLKYISDAFEAKHAELAAQRTQGADPEDPDEYRAVNIFWVPPEARWTYLKSMAPQPTIGQLVDDAMSARLQRPHRAVCVSRLRPIYPPQGAQTRQTATTAKVGRSGWFARAEGRYRCHLIFEFRRNAQMPQRQWRHSRRMASAKPAHSPQVCRYAGRST